MGASGMVQAQEQNSPQYPFISTSAVAVTTGDYGTGDDTTVTQLSQAFKYQGPAGEIGMMVPYLFRNGGAVTVGESRRLRSGQPLPNEADGLGDIQVMGKYFWLEEAERQPGIDLAARVKIPTADEDEGLGTGRFDVGFGPQLHKRFGPLITFADAELVLRDKPSGSSIESVRLDYSLGVGYPFTEQFTGYVSLDGGTKANSGAEVPLEIVLSGVFKATDTIGVNGFILAGLTDGSPDFGAGTGITVKF